MTSKKIVNNMADNIDPSLFDFAEYDESKSELSVFSKYSHSTDFSASSAVIQTIHFGDLPFKFL